LEPTDFPKRARLRKRWEFERLQKGAAKIIRPLVLALWRPNGAGLVRLGITASKRVGNAVARNRGKRWVREWFRRERSTLPAGLDLVLVLRPGVLQAGHDALLRDLGRLSGALRLAARR
jgi:ribonuclease P protein component